MSSKLLEARAVARPWGRATLPAPFEKFSADQPVGEIWHEPAGGDLSPLLAKHLFTADRLSVQVHPDDHAARQRGFPWGKDEAWLILHAAPGARLGLGLTRNVSREELRASAQSGEIERLLDWRAVRAGEFFYSPAGTIHAIGAGLELIEIQQNLDVTYRLYDYQRPRELHLDEAVRVAVPDVWRPRHEPATLSEGRTLLVSNAAFVVEHWVIEDATDMVGAPPGSLVIHKSGRGSIDAAPLLPGSVWSAEGGIEFEPRQRLEIWVVYPGAEVIETLRRDH